MARRVNLRRRGRIRRCLSDDRPLPADPGADAVRRALTSTNTSVSPSIATRSISAPAPRKFRLQDPVAVAPQITLGVRSPRRPSAIRSSPANERHAEIAQIREPLSRRDTHASGQNFTAPQSVGVSSRRETEPAPCRAIANALTSSEPRMLGFPSMAQKRISLEQVRPRRRLARLELHRRGAVAARSRHERDARLCRQAQ